MTNEQLKQSAKDEAAREIANPLRAKTTYKYPTIDDYLNSKK